jgi:hypothetical protein
LKDIKNTLSVGNISKNGQNSVIYSVDSIKEIPVIINHFDQYPLITNKVSDYLIFKQCFDIIKQGEHLNEKGLLKLLALKSSLNLGLPDGLKMAFPNVKAIKRPEYFFKGIPDPLWLSGFISGEGSFHVVTKISNKEVFTRFSVHLHIRDLEVLKGINIQFKKYNPEFYSILEDLDPEKRIYLSTNSVQLQIKKQNDIINTVIPFFNEFPILGCKSLDFEDFKKICYLLNTTQSNKKNPLLVPKLCQSRIFNEILEIKKSMNLNRK